MLLCTLGVCSSQLRYDIVYNIRYCIRLHSKGPGNGRISERGMTPRRVKAPPFTGGRKPKASGSTRPNCKRVDLFFASVVLPCVDRYDGHSVRTENMEDDGRIEKRPTRRRRFCSHGMQTEAANSTVEQFRKQLRKRKRNDMFQKSPKTTMQRSKSS